MQSFIKPLINIATVLFILYGIVVLLFYLFQDNFLFFPRESPVAIPENAGGLTEKVEIHCDETGLLSGWFCRNNDSAGKNVVIYFGGNAEEASGLIQAAGILQGWSMLLVNYPGYGNSGGKAGEADFMEASLCIYDYLHTGRSLKPEKTVLMGRSIGTGVATRLASLRDVDGVILVSPYGSMTDVARDNFSFLPVGLILRHKFESKKYARDVNAPLLAIYGTADELIPPAHSLELIQNWAGKTESCPVEGRGHNNILESPEPWMRINKFLSEIKALP
jgi:pimeloyl-ACP methyl ester carboxylesterase